MTELSNAGWIEERPGVYVRWIGQLVCMRAFQSLETGLFYGHVTIGQGTWFHDGDRARFSELKKSLEDYTREILESTLRKI